MLFELRYAVNYRYNQLQPLIPLIKKPDACTILSRKLRQFGTTWKLLVPYLRGKSWPIFEKSQKEFFDTTVRSLFDENSLSQFYIRLCVQIFNLLFFLFLKLLLNHIFFYTFEKVFTAHIEVYADATTNGGHLKQSNSNYRMVVPPLKILRLLKIYSN